MRPHPPQRFLVHLRAPAPLPLTYREGLQAALYRLLPPELGRWIHDEGVRVGGRPLKPLVFSRVLGLELGQDRRFYPKEGEVRFLWASSLPPLAEILARSLQEQGGLLLYGQLFPLVLLEELPLPRVRGALEVVALSPVTAYRTEGRKTRYLGPQDPDFSLLLEENLNRKAVAVGLPRGRVRVRPAGGNRSKLERYKGFWVEGWMGRFLLEGDEHLLRLALTAGLGAKNAQGFGYVLEGWRRV